VNPDRDGIHQRVLTLHGNARRAVQSYQFGRASTLLHTALRMLDRGPQHPDPELQTIRIRVLVSLAWAEAETGPLAVGLGRLDDAEQLHNALSGPQRAELAGLVRQQRGLLLYRAGRIEESLELLSAAVPLLEQALSHGVGDPDVLAGTLLNRGRAYLDRVQTAAAAREFQRCIQLCADHRLDLLAAKAQHNLGYLAYLVGDLPMSLRQYEQAGRCYRDLAAGLLPTLRLDQARALLAAGLAEEAARQLDEALPALRQQRVSQDLAETVLTRAAASLLTGEIDQARRLARTAQRAFRRRGNGPWAAIAALTALRADTVTALDRGKVPRALVGRAAKLADQLAGLRLDEEAALTRMLAARLELRRSSPAAAAAMLANLARPRRTTPVDHRMLRRLCRAELAIAAGNRPRALSEARIGLAELGRIRDRMGGLELVCGTAAHGRELGELAVRLILEAPDSTANARRLFEWLERTRAQVYRYEPLPVIDDPVLANQATEIRHLRRAVQQGRVEGRSVSRQAAACAAAEREVQRQGWYASPWGRPRPVCGLPQVAGRLGERVLVSFAASGDALVAVVVRGGKAGLVRLGSAPAAAELARQLHADMNALAPDHLPGVLATTVRNSARQRAHALDQQLIRPLLPVIGDRELVIVPTGALYAVPWGALPVLRGRPLVVVPSATAWVGALEAAAARGAGAPPLGAAGSDDEPIVLVRGPGLVSAAGEVSRLLASYPSATLMQARQASVAAVLAAVDGARLAHLAAHGAHEPANALFSRLELVDGPLFAHEVSRLRRPPEQVVLAACELALNRIRPGDEALGFAGALLAGGVRTVVAALSRVGDEEAATALTSYHQQLAAGARPAVALAAAVAADPFRRPFICLGSG